MRFGAGDVRAWILACALAGSVAPHAAAGAQSPATHRTRYVVLITTDGLRWQEVFGGADSTLLNKEHGGVGDTAAIRRDFWRATAEARRATLLPFMWDSVARKGELFGNRAKNSRADVVNGLNFSYPGYNELLTGVADPRLNSNSYGPNPNVTVLEWISGLRNPAKKVAAFGNWDAFDRILNRDRATQMHVRTAWETPFKPPRNARQAQLNELFERTSRANWGNGMTFDAFTGASVMEYVRTERPHVLYVALGETDEWAHSGRYDHMLRSARAADRFVAELWALYQSMPATRGRTTFIITTDHGRGTGLRAWRDHGAQVVGSEQIWIALLGPDTPALGERVDVPPVTQSQVAATVAGLLGYDWIAVNPRAGEPLHRQGR